MNECKENKALITWPSDCFNCYTKQFVIIFKTKGFVYRLICVLVKNISCLSPHSKTQNVISNILWLCEFCILPWPHAHLIVHISRPISFQTTFALILIVKNDLYEKIDRQLDDKLCPLFLSNGCYWVHKRNNARI